MGSVTLRYYEQLKDYLDPHLNEFMDYYRYGRVIHLPIYHDCDRVNKNGTKRKFLMTLVITAVDQLGIAIGEKPRINTEGNQTFTGQDT